MYCAFDLWDFKTEEKGKAYPTRIICSCRECQAFVVLTLASFCFVLNKIKEARCVIVVRFATFLKNFV